MSRPKGSKNKDKTALQLIASRLESTVIIEPEIEQTITKRKVKEPAVKAEVIKKAVKEVLTKPEKEMRSGWVNIQSTDKQNNKFAMTRGAMGFYTGGDIHESEEQAKAVANKNTVAQAFVRWYS